MIPIDLSSGFGQGAVNNTIGWGQGVTNANPRIGTPNGFGVICIIMQGQYFSSPSTNLTGSLGKPKGGKPGKGK